jgi:ribosomal-protein-alanine N-acetyltransferase
VLVRKANLGDVDDIHRIELAQFKERAFSRDKFKLGIKKGHVYVLATSDAVLGYCMVSTRSNSRTARIVVIAVDPHHTKVGYGSALLDYVELAYFMCGYSAMSLEVNALNYGAIALYERRDYQCQKWLDGYYGEGTIGIKMQKRLKAK